MNSKDNINLEPTVRSSAALPAFPVDADLFFALELTSRRIACDQDQMLFHQDDEPVGLYLIRSGLAYAMIQVDGGRPVACFQANRGAILGLPAVVSNRPYSLSAVARTVADICFVGKETFDELLRVQPSIYISVLKILAAEVRMSRAALSKDCRH